MPRSLAVVGAVGGAGATRITVETAALLARDGRDVAVVDADPATQGLAGFVPGRIDPDLARALTDDTPVGAVATDIDLAGSGSVTAYPIHAAYATMAAAATPEAGERFADVLATLRGDHEFVVVDTGPVADNLAVASVTTADRRALVAPGTDRGADGLARVRDRIADVGATTDAVVANRAPLPDADVTVPAAEDDVTTPICADATGSLPEAIAEVAATTLDVEIDAELAGGLL